MEAVVTITVVPVPSSRLPPTMVAIGPTIAGATGAATAVVALVALEAVLAAEAASVEALEVLAEAAALEAAVPGDGFNYE